MLRIEIPTRLSIAPVTVAMMPATWENQVKSQQKDRYRSLIITSKNLPFFTKAALGSLELSDNDTAIASRYTITEITTTITSRIMNRMNAMALEMRKSFFENGKTFVNSVKPRNRKICKWIEPISSFQWLDPSLHRWGRNWDDRAPLAQAQALPSRRPSDFHWSSVIRKNENLKE